METERIVSSLHPLETRTLRYLDFAEKITATRLSEMLNFNYGQCNQTINWLLTKGLIKEIDRQKVVHYELTDIGEEYQKDGTPEERVIGLVKTEGALHLQEIAARLGLDNRTVGSAYGSLSREGVLAMDSEKRANLSKQSGGVRLEGIRALLDRAGSKGHIQEDELDPAQLEIIQSLSRKRGASRGVFRSVERDEITFALTSRGAEVRKTLQRKGITGEELGVLTSEILRSGEWRDKEFRRYNIQVPPARVLLGRRNPYAEFLQELKDKLVSLGFEEYEGPLVETEFWNCDALYMPQFHSARDIHDVFYVKEPTHAREIAQPYLDQVAHTHENGWETGSSGWKYDFDRKFTKRTILRSQGTVLSAKMLTKAKIPGKYFGVVRCFRYDQVDATHLADFYQTEGIVLGEEVNLKTLLGLLTMFAQEVAQAKDIKFSPGYFPFTEPSVEVHIKHPSLGWFELGGSGIFRPEVTKPLGIDVPVLAWGLGIDRMALMSLGLNDLRDLFTTEIERVRLMRRKS